MRMGFSAHVELMLSFMYAGISNVMRKWVCFGAYAVTPRQRLHYVRTRSLSLHSYRINLLDSRTDGVGF
jgi:kynureninase